MATRRPDRWAADPEAEFWDYLPPEVPGAKHRAARMTWAQRWARARLRLRRLLTPSRW